MQVLAELSVGPSSECVGVLVLGDDWSNAISADTRRLITGELGVSSGDHASIQVSVIIMTDRSLRYVNHFTHPN